MRSKTSLVNGTILKKDISRFWPLWMIQLIYLLIVGPLLTGLSIVSYQRTQFYWDTDIEELIQRAFAGYMGQIFIVVHVAVVSIIAAVLVFNYLNNRRSSYMLHSMPVSRNALFVTHYVSGFLMVTVPFIIVDLIMGIMNIVCGAGMGSALLGYGIQIVLMVIFFYTLACLVVMVSGHGFMSLVIYAVLNCLVIAVWNMFQYVASLFQVGGNYELMTIPTLERITTPVYYYSNIINNHPDGLYSEMMNCRGIGMMCLYLVPAVLFFALAMFLYSRRPLERVGENLAFSWCKPIFKIVFAVAGSLAAMMIWDLMFRTIIGDIFAPRGRVVVLYITFALLCTIFYCIGEMIIEKRFMIWKKLSWLVLGILVAVMLIFLTVFRTIYDKQSTPDSSHVQKLAITIHETKYEFTDKEIIDELTKIHKEIRRELQEDEVDSYSDNTQWVAFDYKWEKVVGFNRSYLLDKNKHKDLINRIDQLLCKDDILIKGLHFDEPDSIKLSDANVDIMLMNEKYKDNFYYLDDQKVRDALFEAVLLDISEGNLSPKDIYYGNQPDDIMFRLNLTFMSRQGRNFDYNFYQYMSIKVTPSCTHTIEVLEKAISDQDSW